MLSRNPPHVLIIILTSFGRSLEQTDGPSIERARCSLEWTDGASSGAAIEWMDRAVIGWIEQQLDG